MTPLERAVSLLRRRITHGGLYLPATARETLLRDVDNVQALLPAQGERERCDLHYRPDCGHLPLARALEDET